MIFWYAMLWIGVRFTLGLNPVNTLPRCVFDLNACLSSPNRDIALLRLTQEYLMEMLGSGHLGKNHDIGREY